MKFIHNLQKYIKYIGWAARNESDNWKFLAPLWPQTQKSSPSQKKKNRWNKKSSKIDYNTPKALLSPLRIIATTKEQKNCTNTALEGKNCGCYLFRWSLCKSCWLAFEKIILWMYSQYISVLTLSKNITLSLTRTHNNASALIYIRKALASREKYPNCTLMLQFFYNYTRSRAQVYTRRRDGNRQKLNKNFSPHERRRKERKNIMKLCPWKKYR